MAIVPIIIAGGSGTRLWPLSRASHPKQFIQSSSLSKADDLSLFQQTCLRISNKNTDLTVEFSKPIVVCHQDHRFLIAEQLLQINLTADIILEPCSRGTAPAIALAANYALKCYQNPSLLILPADHFIDQLEPFYTAIKFASQLAKLNKIVTFGVEITSIETGFGYIKKGELIAENGYLIKQFVEKPDSQRAEQYKDSGDYLWNSGMFLFKAESYLSELQLACGLTEQICRQSILSAAKDLDFIRIDDNVFANCPDNSIDYAVMEKTKHSAVVPLKTQWDDLGSWSAIWKHTHNRDENNNATMGDVLISDSTNCLVHSEHRLVSALGLQDIVIIDCKDALLVATKNQVQNVKLVVDELKKNNRSEWQKHHKVYRPWGHYELLDAGNGFLVKRIKVNPGGKLSLQKHQSRAEHWVVVSGTATVINGDKKYIIKQNQSTYIPIGEVHSLENCEDVELQLIEIQTGDYLSEDDIVRFEDNYGRH